MGPTKARFTYPASHILKVESLTFYFSFEVPELHLALFKGATTGVVTLLPLLYFRGISIVDMLPALDSLFGLGCKEALGILDGYRESEAS